MPPITLLVLLAIILVVSWLLFLMRDTLATVMLKIDGRGWLAVGCWMLVAMVFILMAAYPDLRKDDLFKMLAQGLVLTAFVGLVLSFYFTASKADAHKAPEPPPAPPAP